MAILAVKAFSGVITRKYTTAAMIKNETSAFRKSPILNTPLPTVNTSAEKSGWPKKLPRGQGQGLAYYYSYGGYVAIVTSIASVALLPAAKTFLPKLRLNPQAMAIH